METKLQELTDKVYKEGVEKAQREADQILASARKEAEAIVAEAQKQAAKIAEEAKRNAEDVKRNTASEIKLASTQAIGALKVAIEQAITTRIVDAPVKETFANTDFVAQIIAKAVDGFATKGQADIKVILPDGDLADLKERISKSLSAELGKGLSIEVGKVKSGFKIGPADGSFFISFTEDDFRNFFKAYIRTQTAEMLFDK